MFYEQVKELIEPSIILYGNSCPIILDLFSFLILEHEIKDTVCINSGLKELTIHLSSGGSNLKKDEFLSRYCKADFFICDHKTKIEIKKNNQLTEKDIMVFLSTIPRSMSKFLSVEQLTKLDKDIFKELSQANKDSALRLMEKWGKEKDFPNKILEGVFRNYLSSSTNKIKEKYSKEIQESQYNIKTSEERITQLLKEIREYENKIREIGLLINNINSPNGFDKELSDIIGFAKTLEGVHFSRGAKDGTLTVSLRQPLDMIDNSLWTYAKDNENSALYEYAPDVKAATMLFESLWESKKVKLYVECAFNIDGLIAKIEKTAYRFWQNDTNTIAQPHIVEYSCIGGFAESFVDIARNGDFYSAIMTMISSCRSLNLADSVVCTDLSRILFLDLNGKKPLLYNKKYYNTKELIEILRREDNEKN